MKYVLFASLPTVFVLGTAEILARVELRLRHGYSYAEALAYLPDTDLVYKSNPLHHSWRHNPAFRYDFFFIPPPSDDGPSPRLMVLGGSTSEARPDGADWPTVLGELSGGTVVNLGHSGYGTGQLRILYERYAHRLEPDAVVLFSGWNGRGSGTSPFGWRPVNTSSRFDSWPHRISAFLINYSALYGRLWHFVANAIQPTTCRKEGGLPPEEMAMWEQEYRDLAQEISRDYPVYIVLFPGIVMREDMKNELPPSFSCIADNFDAAHDNYNEIIRTIEAIGNEVGAACLDVRPAYMALPSNVHVSYFTDQLHQTAEGNRYLAAGIYREVERATQRSDLAFLHGSH